MNKKQDIKDRLDACKKVCRALSEKLRSIIIEEYRTSTGITVGSVITHDGLKSVVHKVMADEDKATSLLVRRVLKSGGLGELRTARLWSHTIIVLHEA